MNKIAVPRCVQGFKLNGMNLKIDEEELLDVHYIKDEIWADPTIQAMINVIIERANQIKQKPFTDAQLKKLKKYEAIYNLVLEGREP